MDKYRLAANITVYHILSKWISQRIIIAIFVVQWVIWGKVQYRIWNPHRISKSFKLFKSVHKQGNWTFVVQRVIWGKYNIGFGWNSHHISKSKKKKLLKLAKKQRNYALIKNAKIVMFKLDGRTSRYWL